MRSNRFNAFFNLSAAAAAAASQAHAQRIFADSSGKPFDKANAGGGFQAKVNNAADRMEIIMHDAIGDYWAGLDSKTVVQNIKDAKGKPIDLDINSFGGDAYAGIAIYNALAMHDAEVTANITGIAYSAASIIPMAADTINISENASCGIHPAWLYSMGNQFALRDDAKWLETLDGQLMDTYAARTGRPLDEIKTWFIGDNNNGTVFSGKQCVEYGFADTLIPLKVGKQGTAEDSGKTAPSNDIAVRMEELARRHASASRRERLLKMIEQSR